MPETPAGTGPADSAGVPWQGRHFEENPAPSDDGSAPPALVEALRRFHGGTATKVDVVEQIRSSRLLVPLVAQLGDRGIGARGLVIDKSADLSIVTVAGPDGRAVLPVFSSVEAMARWNPGARPVPTQAVRVALAAASEGTDLVVLDAASPHEFVIRRPAVWAIARQQPWAPSWTDAAVATEFTASAAGEPDVIAVDLADGDPTARQRAPELSVSLTVRSGLARSELDALLARLQDRWGGSSLIAETVDSLAVRVIAGG